MGESDDDDDEENDDAGDAGAKRWNYEDVPRKVDEIGATAFSYDDAAHFAFLSDVVYEKSKDVFAKVAKDLGYDDVEYFDSDGAQCYGLARDSYVVLAFRGTNELRDWMANFSLRRVKDPKSAFACGDVHCGFVREVDKLWPEITEWLSARSGRQIYVCGHSLGGALSGVAASRLPAPVICYTYGAPRIGSKRWTAAFNALHKMYRFVNDRDIIPRTPPKWMRYRHPGELHFIDTHGAITKNPNRLYAFVKASFHNCANPCRLFEGPVDHMMTKQYCPRIEKWAAEKRRARQWSFCPPLCRCFGDEDSTCDPYE